MSLNPVPFHVGIVVEDITASATQLSALLGVQWGEVVEIRKVAQWTGGRREIVLRLRYSLSGPAHLELIQRIPDSVWSETGLHHIGLWSDDIVNDSRACQALGLTQESVLVDEVGAWYGGLYHCSSEGLRVELSDLARTGPFLAGYLAGDAVLPD